MPPLSGTHDACCQIPTVTCPCSISGNAGRKVIALTLDNRIPPHLRKGFGNEATFCSNPACEVVYCNPAGRVIRKGQTRLPVTIKDAGDDVNVCYCFEHTRGDIRRDLKEKGRTDIPDQIKRGIQEGRCDCQRKNPQGACCLGNVTATIRAIQDELRG